MPKCIRQMLTVGPLARSVEDLRLCLQLIAGVDPRQLDIPPVPLDTPSPKSLQNLRIAWTDEFPAFPVASEIKKAIQSVAKTLDNGRTHVEQWVPKFDFVAAWQIAWATSIYSAVCAAPVRMDAAFIRKKTAFMFREATQGEREFRKLGVATCKQRDLKLQTRR